jgi:hypothetical protein
MDRAKTMSKSGVSGYAEGKIFAEISRIPFLKASGLWVLRIDSETLVGQAANPQNEILFSRVSDSTCDLLLNLQWRRDKRRVRQD